MKGFWIIICGPASFAGSLVTFLRQYPCITVRIYDGLHGSIRAFGAKKLPFVGVLEDGKPVAGFYSENGTCTEDNVKDYVRNNISCSEDTDGDEPSDWKEQLEMYMKRNIITI